MRISLVILAGLCLSLLPLTASGETYSSDRYGFSAAFPAEPVAGTPQGSETGAKGRFISNSVIFKTQVMGVYTAMVTVESYTVPMNIDTSARLQMMVQIFAADYGGRITSSKPGKLDDHRARFFSYEKPDHSSGGNGVVVVVQDKLPRAYMAVSMHTALASESDIAALDKFVASFHVK